MSKTPLYFPALRGKFGDRTYYSCLMPLRDLADRVSYASELHKNKGLSDMLQRVLDEERAENIAKYLRKQDERFFNSLVVAVYGGEPQWFAAGRITARNSELELDKIDPVAQESIGFLKLRGDEKLFTLDGQHRLAGIRRAVKDKPTLGKEVQSAIFVGHKRTPAGRERTRRLFTTLNKTAKPVSKNEIIALDEDDVMAIVARRLVETHPWFSGKRIAFSPTANLAANEPLALTTIINLYDILTTLYTKVPPQRGISELKYYRPSDEALELNYQRAREYFDLLATNFPPLKQYFAAKNYSKVIKRYRGDFGGDVLFRPIGLTLITEVIATVAKHRSLEQAMKVASRAPRTLSAPPYLDVLWDRRRGMGNQGRALARDLVLHTLGELSRDKSKELGKKYARALDLNSNQWKVALGKLPKV
jgi:DNA sulfur modification protein DndB